MKNLFQKAFTICSLIVLTILTACTENKTPDSAEIAEQKNIDKLVTNEDIVVVVDKDYDAKFLMAAAAMQLEAIELGKIAQQKSATPRVKELGKMMEKDHTSSYSEMTDLAKAKNVSIPTNITNETENDIKNLNEKTGKEFDKKYSGMMVDAHQDAVKLFEKASTESEDSDIRTWASITLVTLRTHLTHAEQCKEECDKM